MWTIKWWTVKEGEKKWFFFLLTTSHQYVENSQFWPFGHKGISLPRCCMCHIRVLRTLISFIPSFWFYLLLSFRENHTQNLLFANLHREGKKEESPLATVDVLGTLWGIWNSGLRVLTGGPPFQIGDSCQGGSWSFPDGRFGCDGFSSQVSEKLKSGIQCLGGFLLSLKLSYFRKMCVGSC